MVFSRYVASFTKFYIIFALLVLIFECVKVIENFVCQTIFREQTTEVSLILHYHIVIIDCISTYIVKLNLEKSIPGNYSQKQLIKIQFSFCARQKAKKEASILTNFILMQLKVKFTDIFLSNCVNLCPSA